MAFLELGHVAMRGVAAAVSERTEFNRDFARLSPDQLEQYIHTVGVRERRCAVDDGTLCMSALCSAAVDRLLGVLGWERGEIGLLVFVSYTRDYTLPSTACILRDCLGLSREIIVFDVPLGCSGFVYGLSIAGRIVVHGQVRKALPLVGNT